MDAVYLYSMLNGYGGGRRGRRAKKKAPKPKKENWFERLTVDQLKQICKAAKLPTGGTKKDLISRLLENESTEVFGRERIGRSVAGCTVEVVKDMCRTRFLQVTGTKLDLVLRVLHHDNASTPEGTTLKRAATETAKVVDERTGEVKEVQVARKRVKATNTGPSVKGIYNQIQRKIKAVSQKKYQTYFGAKQHAPDVYSLLERLMRQEVIPLVGSDPMYALSLARAAFTSISDNFDTMEMPGYDDGEFCSAVEHLRTVVSAARSFMSDAEAAETADWIEGCEDCVVEYGLGDDADMNEIISSLRGGEGAGGSNDGKGGGKEEENEKENAPADGNVPVPKDAPKKQWVM